MSVDFYNNILFKLEKRDMKCMNQNWSKDVTFSYSILKYKFIKYLMDISEEEKEEFITSIKDSFQKYKDILANMENHKMDLVKVESALHDLKTIHSNNANKLRDQVNTKLLKNDELVDLQKRISESDIVPPLAFKEGIFELKEKPIVSDISVGIEEDNNIEYRNNIENIQYSNGYLLVMSEKSLCLYYCGNNLIFEIGLESNYNYKALLNSSGNMIILYKVNYGLYVYSTESVKPLAESLEYKPVDFFVHENNCYVVQHKVIYVLSLDHDLLLRKKCQISTNIPFSKIYISNNVLIAFASPNNIIKYYINQNTLIESCRFELPSNKCISIHYEMLENGFERIIILSRLKIFIIAIEGTNNHVMRTEEINRYFPEGYHFTDNYQIGVYSGIIFFGSCKYIYTINTDRRTKSQGAKRLNLSDNLSDRHIYGVAVDSSGHYISVNFGDNILSCKLNYTSS